MTRLALPAVGAALGVILSMAGGPALAVPVAFDCDLALRRIDALVDEIGRDVRDHEGLRATLATVRPGALVTERQAAEITRTRRLAAYIEKLVPQKFDDVQRNANQAQARDCIAEERARSIVEKAKAAVDRVVGADIRP